MSDIVPVPLPPLPELGPLELIVSWQAVALAIAIAAITSVLKRLVDYVAGGPEKRKANYGLTRVLLPAIPLLVGALLAEFVPLLPDQLVAYIAALPPEKNHAVRAVYGVVLGAFADYLWSRYSSLLKPRSTKKRGG